MVAAGSLTYLCKGNKEVAGDAFYRRESSFHVNKQKLCLIYKYVQRSPETFANHAEVFTW